MTSLIKNAKIEYMSEFFDAIAARHVADPSYHSLNRLASVVLSEEIAVPASVSMPRDLRYHSYDQQDSWNRKFDAFLGAWDPELLAAEPPADFTSRYGRALAMTELPVAVRGNTQVAAIPTIGRFRSRSLVLRATGSPKPVHIADVDLTKLSLPAATKDPQLAHERLQQYLRQYKLAHVLLEEVIEKVAPDLAE